MIKPLFQKIVVAINGSDQSLHAAMYAILLAKQYKCSLKAVYVVDTAALKFLSMSKFFLKTESQKYEENLLDDGKKYLEQIVTFAKIKGVKVETELRKGSPWSEILHAADDFDADLIFLCISGRKRKTLFCLAEKNIRLHRFRAKLHATGQVQQIWTLLAAQDAMFLLFARKILKNFLKSADKI